MSSAGVVALAVYPDGAVTEVALPAGRVLEALYGVIGCRCVDVVRLREGLDMWVDDEGMLAGDASEPATRLARTYGFVWQPYFGVVVVTGGADAAGDTLSLGAGDARTVRELLARPARVGGQLPGGECAGCGHRHAGVEWGEICVGCSCMIRPGQRSTRLI